MGNAAACAQLNPDLSKLNFNPPSITITNQPVNFASQTVEGVDFEADYRFALAYLLSGWGGNVQFRWLGTDNITNLTATGLSVPTQAVTAAVPRWRHNVSMTYTANPIAVTFTGRLMSSGVQNTAWIQCTTGCPAATVNNPTFNQDYQAGAFYLDTAINYNFEGPYGSDDQLYFNVTNLYEQSSGTPDAGSHRQPLCQYPDQPVAVRRAGTGIPVGPPVQHVAVRFKIIAARSPGVEPGAEMTRIRYAGSLFAAAMGSAMLVASPAQAANSVSAGAFTVRAADAAVGRLSLGHHRRRQPQRQGGCAIPQEGRYRLEDRPADAARGRRRRDGRRPAIGQSSFMHYLVPNMMSGSIFYLQPDTDYEAQFKLSDPDGGSATKMIAFHTRKEPMPAAGGHVYHVYPPDWTGPMAAGSVVGLERAYFVFASTDDHENAYPCKVQPGDTILVHAGLYIGDQHHYLGGGRIDGNGALFDGTMYLNCSGTADKPIVIKAAGDGEVIFDGNGNGILFNLEGANYNYFEGITVRNADVAFLLGNKVIAGSSGFTLKHSKLYNVGRGVQDDWSGSKDFYIADNNIDGRHDPVHMMGWGSNPIWQKFPSYPELLSSEYGVKVYGQGHVVAYNHVTNFHDGVDFATYGAPDGIRQDALTTSHEIPDRFPESNDFYGNDITEMGDNCIEADGAGRNMRVFNNRCFNMASGAVSVEPGYGGPTYFIRNIMYEAFPGRSQIC